MSRETKIKKAHPAEAERPGWLAWLKGLRRYLVPRSKGLLDDPAEHIARIKRQAATDSSEAAAFRAALKGLLDRHASSRSVLMHLSVLEKALGKHGMKALDELPAEVLRRAMSQLEAMVSDWSQPGFAALRARLTDALIRQGRDPGRRRVRASDFQDSRQLQVKDASVSTFLAARAQWEQSTH